MRGRVHSQRAIFLSWLNKQPSRPPTNTRDLTSISTGTGELRLGYSALACSSPWSLKQLVPLSRVQPQRYGVLPSISRGVHSGDGREGGAVERVECVVIGAGVVGLAVARKLARSGREVVVVDSAEAIGTGTSSRNSEVIHAGIYYPSHSLKAKLCIQGRRALYQYCVEHGVPHRACGKLIVATSEAQVPTLHKLWQRGKANGVEDLRMLSAEEAHAMEPELRCTQALLSPVTGILDSHSFMLSLQGDAEVRGAAFAFNSTVVSGAVTTSGIRINVSDTTHIRSALDAQQPTEEVCPTSEKGQSSPRPRLQLTTGQSADSGGGSLLDSMSLEASIVVNCGGLDAMPIARRIAGMPLDLVPRRHLARGCYFALTAPPPFSRLIYPVPEDGGLGVHVTIDLGGQVKFGPDVEWLGNDTSDAIFTDYDYHVDAGRSARFYPEVRKYFPNLPDSCIRPDYAGIRPKLTGPGDVAADFLIQGEAEHGVKGLVNLFGIESPGLTASLAIADHVCSRLEV